MLEFGGQRRTDRKKERNKLKNEPIARLALCVHPFICTITFGTKQQPSFPDNDGSSIHNIHNNNIICYVNSWGGGPETFSIPAGQVLHIQVDAVILVVVSIR